jgi:tetratricopeptide (TPR) repeat protein
MNSYTKTSVTQYLEKPDSLDPLELKKMGEWAKQNNEIHLTIECYLKLLNYETVNANICFLHNELGICYMALNQAKSAIQHFENIVTMGANIAEVYNNLVICCRKDKQYKKAESYAMKSLQLEQNDKIYNTIADLYFYMKEYEKSLYFYLKINDQISIIKYNMSFPYLAKKIFIKGFELYENRLASNGICEQT